MVLKQTLVKTPTKTLVITSTKTPGQSVQLDLGETALHTAEDSLSAGGNSGASVDFTLLVGVY